VATPGDFETKRLAYNAHILASPLPTVKPDIASEVRLQDPNDTTVYQSDKAHLKNAGHLIAARDWVVPAILTAMAA
jgi:hypothetical protein